MPSYEDYEKTTIDWGRLRKYAERVARETRLTPDAPWSYTTTVSRSEVVSPAREGFFGIGAKAEVRRDVFRNESVRVLPEHWVIDRRQWNRRQTSHSVGVRIEENDREEHVFALLRDGELKVAVLTTNEVWNYRGPKTELVVPPNSEHRVRDMDEHHVRMLDFEKRYYDGSGSRSSTFSWGDRDPGRRLLRHAKGVGLNLELKRILEGRRWT